MSVDIDRYKFIDSTNVTINLYVIYVGMVYIHTTFLNYLNSIGEVLHCINRYVP